MITKESVSDASLIVVEFKPSTMYTEAMLCRECKYFSDSIIVTDYLIVNNSMNVLDNLMMILKIYGSNDFSRIDIFLESFNLSDKKYELVSNLLNSEISNLKLFPLFLIGKKYFIDDIEFDYTKINVIITLINKIVNCNKTICVSQSIFDVLVNHGFIYYDKILVM